MKTIYFRTIKATSYFLLILLASPLIPAFASLSDTEAMQIVPTDARTAKYTWAAIAFSSAAISAGWAISRAGSAGLAGTAERPEIKTTAIIITALGEALAIYGIVIAIMILTM